MGLFSLELRKKYWEPSVCPGLTCLCKLYTSGTLVYEHPSMKKISLKFIPFHKLPRDTTQNLKLNKGMSVSPSDSVARSVVMDLAHEVILCKVE